MKHPEIKPYDWIRVGNRNCVVMNIYPSNSPFGVCKVVFNPQKPTTHDVDWNGQQWFFPERPDVGGYGRDGCPFVRKLKQGI